MPTYRTTVFRELKLWLIKMTKHYKARGPSGVTFRPRRFGLQITMPSHAVDGREISSPSGKGTYRQVVGDDYLIKLLPGDRSPRSGRLSRKYDGGSIDAYWKKGSCLSSVAVKPNILHSSRKVNIVYAFSLACGYGARDTFGTLAPFNFSRSLCNGEGRGFEIAQVSLDMAESQMEHGIFDLRCRMHTSPLCGVRWKYTLLSDSDSAGWTVGFDKENNGTDIGEAIKQWSAVANTIATTVNKECLDLFIQLDGLWFINKWLNDAQKLRNDTGSEVSEELIIALLRALERLQLDHQRSVGSGIGETVQGLVSHSSLVVQAKAKALCDTWAPIKEIDETPTDVNAADVSPHGNNNEEKCGWNSNVENEKSKSESIALTGNANPSEDVEEKQEIDPLAFNITDVNIGGGLHESPGAENLKSISNTDSDEDEKKDLSESENDSGSHSRSSSKRSMKSNDGDLISKRPSDMELDYGMVDPLDIARQVANEVESDSPKGSPSSAVPMNDVKTLDIPVAQILEVAQASAHSPEKGFSGFDLNEEIPSEETETNCPVVIHHFSPQYTVVSASRARRQAADGLPLHLCNLRVLSVGKGKDLLLSEKIEKPSRLHSLDLTIVSGTDDAGIISLDWKRMDRISVSKTKWAPRVRLDESVMTLFGTQVEVSRKDYMPPHHHHPHPQPNGRILEPSVDFSLGRPGSGLGLGPSMPYPNLPPYGLKARQWHLHWGPMYAPPGANTLHG
ncbi:putative transcription regulator IWS1 family protein [Tanacetum coccineum]